MKKLGILILIVAIISSFVIVPSMPASAAPVIAALWHLDGNANDDSGNGNNATLYGIPGWVADQWGGQALSCDGGDDYAIVPHSDTLDMTSAYTLEAWINATDDLINKYRPILFRGATNANDIEVYIQARSKNLIVAHNRGNGGSFDFVGFADPPLGTWFHLAVIFDGTDVVAYYNGTPAAVVQRTTAVNAPLDTDKGWWIGKVDHTAFEPR